MLQSSAVPSAVSGSIIAGSLIFVDLLVNILYRRAVHEIIEASIFHLKTSFCHIVSRPVAADIRGGVYTLADV